MPLYGQPVLIATPGITIPLFAAETVNIGGGPAASVAALLKSNKVGEPKAFSVEIQFAADPGAFQVDIQNSDTNTDGSYVTTQSVSSGLNTAFCTRAELVNVVAKYVRVVLVSRTNSVVLTCNITSA